MEIKPKKKFYKRWWFWIIAIIIIGAIGNGGSKEDNNVTKDTSNHPVVAQENNKEPKKEEVKKEPVFDFSKSELTKENITKAISKVIGEDKLKSVDITVENQKNVVDISYNPGTIWNEKSLVENNAVTATNVMEILFKNSKIDKVWVWTETEMQDAKGNNSTEKVLNVCLTRENAKDINWTNFKDKVAGDYKALYNIVDSSFIHPGIAKELN